MYGHATSEDPGAVGDFNSSLAQLHGPIWTCVWCTLADRRLWLAAGWLAIDLVALVFTGLPWGTRWRSGPTDTAQMAALARSLSGVSAALRAPPRRRGQPVHVDPGLRLPYGARSGRSARSGGGSRSRGRGGHRGGSRAA